MKRIRKLTTAFLVIALLVTSLVSVPALAEDDDYDKVIRLAGASRYLTAVEVSKEAYEEADTVIVAAGANFPDALAASALAGKLDAPILLAEQDGFRAGTLEEIEDLGATKAIVLGGEKALGAEVVEALEDAGLKVTRIAGENRYETATLIAKEVLKSSTGKEVFLVNGDEPWDALAIGPVAAEKQIPVLLTKAGALRDETKAFLVDNGIKSVVILGGEKAVSAAARAEIPAGISVQRVYGANREATAIEIAEKYFPNPEALIVASRTKFADALVGGYFGGSLEAPIMLVYEDEIRENVDKYLLAHKDVKEIYILGGEAVVSKAVADELDGYGVVKSIEAIPGQIIGVGDYLEFKVNGKWVLDSQTFGDYFADPGDPDLGFLYDAAGTDLADNDGKGAAAVGEGEYAVTYGELVSEFVPFEVAPADAFSKVTEFVLVDGESEEVKAVVWGDDVSDYAVKALKGVTVDGKAVKKDDLPIFDKWLDSSNKDVIKVTESGELVLRGLGDTALSFRFEDLDAIYYLYVKVEAGPRAAKSIANKNVKAFTYDDKTFDFKDEPFAPVVLDQYGDVIDDYEAYLVIKKGRTLVQEGDLADVEMDEAGTYTVTVYTDKTDGKLGAKLGSYTITLVTQDSGKLEYTLVFVDEEGEEGEDVVEQLDLNLLDPVDKLYLGIRVSIKGVELTEEDLSLVGVDLSEDEDLAVTSSKDTVATADRDGDKITVKAAEGAVTGTTVIKLTSKDGEKVVTLASKNVTVVDTTPTLTLKLAKGVEKLQVRVDGVYEENNVRWKIADYEELVAPELEDYEAAVVNKEMIDSVTFHGGDTPYAMVKVAKEYGGKSFTFNAMLVDVPEGD